MPKRIQRRRVKGWRMPEGCVTRPARCRNSVTWKAGRNQHGMPAMADYWHGRAFAPTAPEAICKAALLAKLESGEV